MPHGEMLWGEMSMGQHHRGGCCTVRGSVTGEILMADIPRVDAAPYVGNAMGGDINDRHHRETAHHEMTTSQRRALIADI